MGAIIISGVLIQLTIGFPIIIKGSSTGLNSSESYIVGDTLQILESCDFEYGEWCAYLIFNKEDNVKSANLLHHKLYKTSNIDLLKEMKRSWVFDCSGSDVATVQSRIVMLKDGEIYFESGIILDSISEGFQSPQCGWIEPQRTENNLYQYCKQFDPVYWPVVFIGG